MQSTVFIYDFISTLEAIKYQCKILHWNASNHNEHEILDRFYFDLIEYQDGVVEEFLGINPTKIVPSKQNVLQNLSFNAEDLIKFTVNYLKDLSNTIMEVPLYRGILSETDSFIHRVHKYLYLIRLV